MLGDKLSQQSEESLSEAASICYLVGMSPEQLVTRWSRARAASTASTASTASAELTTLALLARRAAQQRSRQIQVTVASHLGDIPGRT